jgi:CheY-like chemotaxis protein
VLFHLQKSGLSTQRKRENLSEVESKLKVLVVEDEEITRWMLKKMIENEGFVVQDAENGEIGLKMFKSFKPDIVFSDISMPVMDGLKMLEEIRKIDYDAIVVMTTAFGSSNYTLQALRLRANDYLLKPINRYDLNMVLKKYRAVLSEKTADREINDLILYRELTMKMDNSPEKIGRVVDRLVQETEGKICKQDRLGIRLGLMEMILNALEHGNLGITYEDKTEVLDGDPDAWIKLVEERKQIEPYLDRMILIKFKMDMDFCEWVIIDEGDGFDWENIPDFNDPENIFKSHGRGIMLTRMNFDQVEFLGKGNQVRLRKRIFAEEKPLSDQTRFSELALNQQSN